MATIDMNFGDVVRGNLAIVTFNFALWRWHEKPGVAPDAPGFVRRGSRRRGVLRMDVGVTDPPGCARARRFRCGRCCGRARHPGTSGRPAGLRRRRTGRSILGIEGGRQHRQDPRDAELTARSVHGGTAQAAIDSASSALQDFEQMDGRARDYARTGQKLLASDLIFSNGYELTTAAASAVEDARRAEPLPYESKPGARAAAVTATAAAAGVGLFVMLLLLPVGARPKAAPERPRARSRVPNPRDLRPPEPRLKKAGRPRRWRRGRRPDAGPLPPPPRVLDAARGYGGDTEGARGTTRRRRSARESGRGSRGCAAYRPERSRVALLGSRTGRGYACAARDSGARRGGARCVGDRAVDRRSRRSRIESHRHSRLPAADRVPARARSCAIRKTRPRLPSAPHCFRRSGLMRCRTAPLRRRSLPRPGASA